MQLDLSEGTDLRQESTDDQARWVETDSLFLSIASQRSNVDSEGNKSANSSHLGSVLSSLSSVKTQEAEAELAATQEMFAGTTRNGT